MSNIVLVENQCLPKLLVQRGGTTVSHVETQGLIVKRGHHDEHFQFESDS